MAGTGPFAVIMEDDHDASEVFDNALGAAGFVTERITSGDVALERLAVAVPDLVILDLRLPNVPGTDVLCHIRTDPLLAHTRVVVTTAFPEVLHQCEAEADLVLVKPISYNQFRRAVMGLHFPRYG